MIKEIDGLKLPATIEGSAELVNFDTQKRSVSGKLITKLSPTEKWKVTINYDKIALSLTFQNEFYNKCLKARGEAVLISFISPYDGALKNIYAKCVSRTAPLPLAIFRGLPTIYNRVGAVFEEV